MMGLYTMTFTFMLSSLPCLHTFWHAIPTSCYIFKCFLLYIQHYSLFFTSEYLLLVKPPTGLAAFNVGGTTIHRLFQLPIEHEGKSATYWSLPKPSQKVMKTTLRNVKMFIIDEISMVSSINLAYMHLRLEELFGGDEWFGSKNMLFVGDLLQLPPVSGNPVFEKIAKKLSHSNWGVQPLLTFGEILLFMKPGFHWL